MRRLLVLVLLVVVGVPSIAILQRRQRVETSKPSATIAYGSDPLQRADLRIPAGKGPYPVAVLIHGGCWRSSTGSRQEIAGLASALQARGIATWNIEFRGVGSAGGGWPGTFTDVAAAADELLKIAPRYRLDLKRVTVIGHSSGGQLALWLASRPKLPLPWSATALRPVSVVAIDAPPTLAAFIGDDARSCGGQAVIADLMGGLPSDRQDRYRIATPAEHLPLGVRQLFVVADLGGFMKPYINAAKNSGDAVDVLEPFHAHHFDVIATNTRIGDAVTDFIVQKSFVHGSEER